MTLQPWLHLPHVCPVLAKLLKQTKLRYSVDIHSFISLHSLRPAQVHVIFPNVKKALITLLDLDRSQTANPSLLIFVASTSGDHSPEVLSCFGKQREDSQNAEMRERL